MPEEQPANLIRVGREILPRRRERRLTVERNEKKKKGGGRGEEEKEIDGSN